MIEVRTWVGERIYRWCRFDFLERNAALEQELTEAKRLLKVAADPCAELFTEWYMDVHKLMGGEEE